MNKMGLEQSNKLILMKKIVIWVKLYFLAKNSGFGNRTRVEGKDDYETGAGA